MAHCDKHGDYEEQAAAIFGMQLSAGCPLCAEERDAELSREEEAARAREAAAQRALRLSEMNIEPAYFDATLDNFATPTPELQHAISRVRDLVAGRIKKIIMLGANGTGKTHLACAAVQALGGRILTMYEISTMIRASYTPMAKRTELEIVDELARLPLLAIDEIGRTRGGDAEANWLSYIIDKRHVRALPLILISNKHARVDCPVKLPDGTRGCPNCLENYIGEDIMSRLFEGGALLKFSGADYRKSVRKTA
jgi:DNA replication protein DnaC